MMVLKKLSTLGFAVALLATNFSAHAMEEFQPATSFQLKLLAEKEKIGNTRRTFYEGTISELVSLEAVCVLKLILNKDKTATVTKGLDDESILTNLEAIAESSHQADLSCFQILKDLVGNQNRSTLKGWEQELKGLKGWAWTNEDRARLTQAQQAMEEASYNAELQNLATAIATLKTQIDSDEDFYPKFFVTLTEEHEADLKVFLAQAKLALKL